MAGKTRINISTNPIVTAVTIGDDENCIAIAKMLGYLGKRYRVVILKENESLSNFDRTAYPSSFVLCPQFIKNKSHHNWGKTYFDLYYINNAKRAGKELVLGGTRNLLIKATPLKLRKMLELLLVFMEIEETEDMTYKKGKRNREAVDSKDESKYFTARRVNVTVHQLCRLLETIEAALDEEDIEAAKKIMGQWEDHILAGSWRKKNAQTKDGSS